MDWSLLGVGETIRIKLSTGGYKFAVIEKAESDRIWFQVWFDFRKIYVAYKYDRSIDFVNPEKFLITNRQNRKANRREAQKRMLEEERKKNDDRQFSQQQHQQHQQLNENNEKLKRELEEMRLKIEETTRAQEEMKLKMAAQEAEKQRMLRAMGLWIKETLGHYSRTFLQQSWEVLFHNRTPYLSLCIRADKGKVPHFGLAFDAGTSSSGFTLKISDPSFADSQKKQILFVDANPNSSREGHVSFEVYDNIDQAQGFREYDLWKTIPMGRLEEKHIDTLFTIANEEMNKEFKCKMTPLPVGETNCIHFCARLLKTAGLAPISKSWCITDVIPDLEKVISPERSHKVARMFEDLYANKEWLESQKNR